MRNCTHTHPCLTWHSGTGPWQPAPCPSVAETSFVRPTSSRCLLPLSLEPVHWAFRGLSTCLTKSVWNLQHEPTSQARKKLRESRDVSSKGYGCCTVIPEGPSSVPRRPHIPREPEIIQVDESVNLPTSTRLMSEERSSCTSGRFAGSRNALSVASVPGPPMLRVLTKARTRGTNASVLLTCATISFSPLLVLLRHPAAT